MAEITVADKLHPAAEWALENDFDAAQIDCTIAVVLKILDNKCKMLPGEKAAIMAIYDIVKQQHGKLFTAEVTQVIDAARLKTSSTLAHTIHELREYAEANIPKPTMKAFKAILRDGLFG